MRILIPSLVALIIPASHAVAGGTGLTEEEAVKVRVYDAIYEAADTQATVDYCSVPDMGVEFTAKFRAWQKRAYRANKRLYEEEYQSKLKELRRDRNPECEVVLNQLENEGLSFFEGPVIRITGRVAE